MAGTSDDHLRPFAAFQDQVWLWLQVWSADRPDLDRRARQIADPEVDPWGYLAELGELILTEK